MSTDKTQLTRAMAKIEILAFYQKNPHTRDTAEGLADRLFLDTASVVSALKELEQVGIIARIELSETAIYRLKVSYATLDEYRLSAKEELPIDGRHSG